ncbi:hypothetical protein, partial [Streptomyces sp. NPDC001774]
EKTYSKVRVWNGGTVSQETDLDGLTGPDNLPQNIKAVEAVPVSSTAGAVRPRANGLDQAPVDIRIQSSSSSTPDLEPGNPAYQYLYYRDFEGRLITGLVQPANPRQYTSVTPYEGVYPNTGMRAAEPKFRTYITTTNVASGTSGNTVKAYLDNGGDVFGSAPIHVAGVNAVPNVQRVGTDTVAAVFGGEKCADCKIASPTASQPALFAAQNGRIGLQFATSALSANLPQIAPGVYDKLSGGGQIARLGLTANNTTAYLEGKFNLGLAEAGDTFTTTIVTKGDALSSGPVPAN